MVNGKISSKSVVLLFRLLTGMFQLCCWESQTFNFFQIFSMKMTSGDWLGLFCCLRFCFFFGLMQLSVWLVLPPTGIVVFVFICPALLILEKCYQACNYPDEVRNVSCEVFHLDAAGGG